MTIAGGRDIARGRPLRALALLGGGVGLWLAARGPVMQRDFRAATALREAHRAAPTGIAVAVAAMPLLLVPIPATPPLLAEAIIPPAWAPPRRTQAPTPTPASAERAGPGFGPGFGPGPDRIVQSAGLAPGIALPPPRSDAPAAPDGDTLATTAYAALANGDRRAAAMLFDAAAAAGPADPRRADWQRARRSLGRHWSGEAAVLLRDAGATGPLVSPILGGGQVGANLAYTIDPLARHPFAVVARLNTALRAQKGALLSPGLDGGSAQAAIGIRWTAYPGVTISAERLQALGHDARSDWTLRIAGGAAHAATAQGHADWSGYAAAGVLGNGDSYAGAQARLAMRLTPAGRIALVAGPAAWGSIQRTATATTDRVDIGPSVQMRINTGDIGFDVSADYRARIAGNAAPGSGPAITVSARF